MPFVKTNITLGHMDYYDVSPCAKVPGGCRLQFEQIARDVQCRKPSSKDGGRLDSPVIQTAIIVLTRFEKKTVATVPKHLLCRFNLLRVDLL